MTTHLNIPTKVEGSTLTAPEFNAVVIAINENADTLQQTFDALTNKLGRTTIIVDSNTSVVIDSIEALIEYIAEYGAATPTNNTAPIIKIKNSTFIYKIGDELLLDIELFDAEGGELTLTGTNPNIAQGQTSFILSGLHNGNNTLNLTALIYGSEYYNPDSDLYQVTLPEGTYVFSDVHVTDKFGKSSVATLNLTIIVGTITLTSNFLSEQTYRQNTPIVVGFGVSSIINTIDLTYTLSGRMLVDDPNNSGHLVYQDYAAVVDKVSNYKLTPNDANFISGQVFFVNYTIPREFTEIGDYNLTISATGLGVISNTLTINIVVNKSGILYSSTDFNTNLSYYVGDTIVLPVNIYYDENSEYIGQYTYQSKAWLEINGLRVSPYYISAPSLSQKGNEVVLLLPDSGNSISIRYTSELLELPENETYWANTNLLNLSLQQKSSYIVLETPISKLELYLNAKGKTNNSPNWGLWENKYTLNLPDNYAVLNGFNTELNGWEITGANQHLGDDLSMNGSAYVEVNYAPLAGFENNTTGLTIEFSIREGALVGEGVYQLSIGRPEITPSVGIYVTANELRINGLSTNISVPIICDSRVLTKNGEWVEGQEYAHVVITFNIDTKEVYVYLNGVISSFGTFVDQELFLTQADEHIYINGYKNLLGEVVGIAETKIRFLRVYKTCLTTDDILANYIACYPEDGGRALLEELNSVATPILSSGYMEGDRSAIQKDIMTQLELSFNPGNEENIADTYIPDPQAIGEFDGAYQTMVMPFPVDVDLQGNSSLSYPIKNYGIDIFDGQAWDLTQTKTPKFYNMVYNNGDPIVRPWPDWDSYHLKANYIDSSHCNNLIIAKLSEQVFRYPFNWENSEGAEQFTPVFGRANPFINYTVTRPDTVVDNLSRYPVYPLRLAVDGFPFIMNGDYKIDQTWYSKRFTGLYTWNLKQHRKLYSMPSEKSDPNRRYYIYRSESNGDSVHEELRSGYCKFLDMRSEQLLVDYYGRVLSTSYIETAQNNELFENKVASDYTWFPINSSEGLLQSNGKYTWVVYSVSKTNTQFENSPIGNLYIGIAVDKTTNIKSTDYHDYTWSSISISEGISNSHGTYTLIRYATDDQGSNLGTSPTNKSHVGIIYNAEKHIWQQGVDYWNKTNDAQELAWRQGAELVMDWECRDPGDFGIGHWEEYLNGVWTRTYNLINPHELDLNAPNSTKTLRWVWDKLETTGKADRSGNQVVDYYTSLLANESERTETYSPTLPSLTNPGSTFYRINKNKAIFATQQHTDFLNAIYWMANATDEAFADSLTFEKFFDLRNCIDYVLCCFTFCLTDSVGRNLTMLGWDENSVETETPGVMNRERIKFHPVFYDIDTAFGTNVQGGLYATPYIEWPYTIAGANREDPNQNYFTATPTSGWEYNCFGTNFFKRMSKCYGPALSRRYQELRSGTYDPLKGTREPSSWISAPFDYSSILQTYSKQMVARIGERYFNKDAVYKYIGFDGDPDINNKRNYISNARGNKLMFMKNFLKKRLDYVDGIMGYVPDADDMAYVEHFYNGTVTLRIKTAIASFIRVSFAQNQVMSKHCAGGDAVVEFSYSYSNTTQHILRIYNSGVITEIEGLNDIALKTGKFSSCPNLKVLNLSGISNFTDQNSYLNLTGTTNLEILNLTGCGLGRQTPFLVGLNTCLRLKEFYAASSAVQVTSFSTNPRLEIINVTNCNFQQAINVDGLNSLTSLLFTKNIITSLNISNTSITETALGFNLANVYTALQTLTIINNTGLTNLTFDETSFTSLNSLNISNCPNLTTVENLFRNRENAVVINDNFLENCIGLTSLNYLFEGSKISSISTSFLKGCTALVEMKGLFKNCTYLTNIPSGALVKFDNLEDISEIFMGARLQTYTPVYTGDVITGITSHNVFKSTFGNVFSECPKLRTIDDAFNGAELINIPANLFLTSPITTAINCFANIVNTNSEFDGTYLGLNVTGSLFVNNPDLRDASSMFENSRIASTQSNLFQTCPELLNASNLFNNSSLSTIPSSIFETASNLEDLSYAFGGTNITSIPSGIISELGSLNTIFGVFNGLNINTLPSGFLRSTQLSSFKFSDLGLTNLSIINSDILLSDSVGGSINNILENINNLFSNTQIANIPNNFLSTNPSINSATNMLANSIISTIGDNFLINNKITSLNSAFAGITRSFDVGNNVMQNSSELLSAINAFQNNTGLTSVGNNFLQSCPKLTTVSGLFMGANNLTSVESNLLSNCPLLVTITDVFNGTAFVTTPINFVYASHLINSLAGVFSNNAIINVSDNFLRGNTGLTTISGIFTGTNITTIGNYFMYQSTRVTSIASLFENSTKIDTIGTHFFGNSGLINANSAFKNSSLRYCTSFDDISTLTTANSTFKNCGLLSNIENYFIASLTMTDVTDCFSSCSTITSASPHNGTTQLWERGTAITNHTGCFYHCSGLTDYYTIPTDWGGLVETTLTFTSSRGLTLTNSNFSSNQTFVKISDSIYKIYTEVSANVTFTYGADIHESYSGSFTSTINRTINTTVTTLALRTFNITYDLGGVPTNSWIQLNGSEKVYANGSGVVTLRSNAALNGNVGGNAAVTKTFNYASSLIDTTYNIGLELKFEIYTTADLIAFRDGVNSGVSFNYNGATVPAYALNTPFYLMNNLNLSTICGSGIGNWIPIGNATNNFKGKFYGNGYTISNLYFNNTGGNYIGLFGYVSGSSIIQDITLTNVMINAQYYVGGLIGQMDAIAGALITNCRVSGTISAAQYIGGLIGSLGGTTLNISKCINNASLSSNNSSPYMGGISGNTISQWLKISKCINNGAITTTNSSAYSIGGIIGMATYLEYIEYSINNGRIITAASNWRYGGIAGYINGAGYSGRIKFCLNTNFVNTSGYSTTSGGSIAETVSDAILNYYDKQFTLLKGLANVDTVNCLGKLTSELIGTSLRSGSTGAGWTDDNWIFTTGAYPIPKGLETYDDAIAGSKTILLDSSINYTNVNAFTVGVGDNVEWNDTNNTLEINNTLGTVNITGAGTEIITTAKNGIIYKSTQLSILLTTTVDSVSDLVSLRDGVNSHIGFNYKGFNLPAMAASVIFNLTTDINLNTVCGVGIGNWLPIGNDYSYCFLGQFNGNNHTISNLYIKNPSVNGNALFGFVSDTVIQNLKVTNVNLSTTTQPYMSAICGCVKINSLINNCYSSGTISGYSNVAGIVGSAGELNIIVSNCINEVNITSQYGSGGILGTSSGGSQNNSIRVEYCINLGNINATTGIAGGIVGDGCGVRYCSNLGNVSGKGSGGILGSIRFGTVEYNTNYGLIYSTAEYIGGIVGKVISGDSVNGTIRYNLNLGKVYGDLYYTYSSSIIGLFNETIVSSTLLSNYYDKQVAKNPGRQLDITNQIEEKTTLQLIGTALRTGSSGVGFTDTNWVFNSGRYPIPKGLETYDAIIGSSEPVIIQSSEDYTDVKSVVTVGVSTGTTWTATNSKITINGNGTTSFNSMSGVEILNAYYNGVKYKSIPITIGTAYFQSSAVNTVFNTYWDTNVNGIVDGNEVAAITTLANHFQGNTGITSFSEINHFIGLTLLNNSEFSGCTNLIGSIILPNNILTIGTNAFENCGLTNIKLPSGLTIINNNTFSGCSLLNSIVLPSGITNVGDNAFLNCIALTNISFWSSTPPTLGSNVFSGTNLTAIYVPYESIDLYKTTWSSYASIIFPIGTITVASAGTLESKINDFYNLTFLKLTGDFNGDDVYVIRELSKLYKLYYLDISAANVKAGGRSYYNGYSIDINNTLGSVMFSYTKLETILFNNNITNLNRGVCQSCEKLINVVLPNNVPMLSQAFFQGCTKLSSIIIPNSITNISDNAFSSCINLRRVVIPSSVTSISSYAFQSSSNLEYIICKSATPPTLGTGVFNAMSPIKIYVPLANLAAYQSASNWSTQSSWMVTTMSFEDSATGTLCLNNFDTNVDGVIQPDDLNTATTIGTVFQGQTTITTFPEFEFFKGITTIPANAFNGCTGLRYLIIPNWVTSIGANAFNGCTGLTDIFISDNCTTVGDSAFAGCTSLTEVIIPNNTTTLGNNVFNGCTGLLKVKSLPSSAPAIGTTIFNNCPALTTINVRTTSVSNYQTNWSTYSSLILGLAMTVVTKFGTLRSVLGSNYLSLTSINLFGTIDGDDISCLKIMASSTTGGNLQNIDISGVRITSYGNYYNVSGNKYWITKDNVMPKYSFDSLNRLQTFILPNICATFQDGFVGSNSNLQTVTFGRLVKTILQSIFFNQSMLNTVTIKTVIPPTLDAGNFLYTNNLIHIYVPTASVNAYKVATNWSAKSTIISAIP